jgi:TonB family protein
VFSRTRTYWLAMGLLLLSGCVVTGAPLACAQDQEIARKTKSKIAPAYPELARRMNITGVVKVQITVDKNGNVKNSKLVGGHPILANAALEAVRKWHFENASEDSIGIVEFHFDPNQ